MSSITEEVVGLIPAAGQATRLGPLPCSKEIFPIATRENDHKKGPAVTVMLESVLRRMRQAGISKAYIVLRDGKWDIPSYLTDGSVAGMHLAYLMRGVPYGVPYTLDQGYFFVRDAKVALGFGDILFQADEAYSRLLSWQSETAAEVVLGLFPADRPDKVDMIDLADGHRVLSVTPKPVQTELSYTWGLAVWTPLFTEFLHCYVQKHKASAATSGEMFVGDVIQAAIENGLPVQALLVSSEPYLDIGTREDLAKAFKTASS